MTQQQPRLEKAATPNIISPQFAEMETRVEAMIDMQTEIFATLARINRDWFDASDRRDMCATPSPLRGLWQCVCAPSLRQ
jgi:hypothetical protein